MSKKNTNKNELILEIQKILGKGSSKAEAERALNATLGALSASFKKGNHVQLVGFGSFRITKRAARNGLNPRTGKPIKIKASKTVRFKPGATVKTLING